MYSCPIVTALDEQFIPYLVVLAASLAKFGNGCQLVIIHRGLSSDVQYDIEKIVAGRLLLKWEEVTPRIIGLANLPLSDQLDPHYFRLLASSLLPAEARALYLDADVLIRGDLTPLIRWPLDKHPIAAVQDDYLCRIRNGISNYLDFGLDPDSPYFNSGVMLMDLEYWRRHNVASRAFNICKRFAAYLCAQGQWPTYDQYGLNVIFANQWCPLPSTWNHAALHPNDAAQLVHFLGIGRPNSGSCYKTFKEEFFALLALSNFDHSNFISRSR